MATVSVAKSLPPEIVCQVLEQLSAPLVLQRSVAQFPFYLGHICSAWRAAFLSMPSDFWNTIILRQRQSSSEDYTTQPRYTEMVKSFLQRSQGRPLSLEIRQSFLFMHPTHFLEMFIKESTRWKNVAFDVSSMDVQFLSLVKDRLPQLRSLALFPQATPKSLAGCEDIFENAPRLTHVTLNDPTNWRLPWQSLTVLHLCEVARYDKLVTDVLPQTPNLEELSFNSAYCSYPTFPAVIFPRLKRLFIFDTFTLLSVICTPLLEQIYLEDGWVDDMRQDPSEIVNAFLLRSSCPLRCLGLGCGALETFAAILPHTPEITSLAFLHNHHLDPTDFFRLLTCVSEEASLAPRLETLRHCGHHTPGSELARMIASRTTDRPAPVQRLKKFIFQSLAGPEITNRLERECTSRDVQFEINTQAVSYIKSFFRESYMHNTSELGLFDV